MAPKEWWRRATIYELYVDKFAGDFRRLMDRLDYFQFLNVNTLHILPHYPSPFVDDGYDVSDYRSVRKELGTLDDFRAFVDAAHARDIRIIVDMVLNHVSSEHPWFREACSSRDNPKRSFFHWSDTAHEYNGASDPFPDIKSTNWVWNEATQDYYYAAFYPQQPDLNWDEPEIFVEMQSVLDFWVDAGVDGFRLDAVPFLIEREGSAVQISHLTHDIVRALRAHLDEKYGGRVIFLAEAGDPRPGANRAYFGEGDQCQLVYNFPLADELLFALMTRNRSRVDALVASSRDLPAGCEWATFLRNHDDVSLTSLNDTEREKLRRFLDPENTYPFFKGQRTAVRLGSVFEHDSERILEAFELLYSIPGVPVMYYGDEIGMRNLPPDPSIRDSRRFVRGAFDWETANRMLTDKDSLLHRAARIIRGHSAG